MQTRKSYSEDTKDGFELIWKPILAYGIWFVIRNAFKKLSFLQGSWAKINDALAAFYIRISAKTLDIMGYSVNYNARNILMGNNQEMYVGDHCLGIAAMTIFCLIIIFLKGPIKHKIWFTMFGLFLIFLANWFRIAGLALMLNLGSQSFFHFNHKYTYLVLVYGLIFSLILLFQNRVRKW